MADFITKLSAMIDPEVMADMVSARIPKKLRVAPFAKIDDTLAGVPGDTITVDSATYRIPYRCCRRCTCRNCKLYLVNTGQSRVLVHLHQVEGKATRLYHLPW